MGLLRTGLVRKLHRPEMDLGGGVRPDQLERKMSWKPVNSSNLAGAAFIQSYEAGQDFGEGLSWNTICTLSVGTGEPLEHF